MSSGVYKIAVARKQHVCTERSYHVIRKGERYLYATCSPWHEMNQSKKWQTIRACLRCANDFGMHTSETRKQLTEAEVNDE